jgi:hypothetical protein
LESDEMSERETKLPGSEPDPEGEALQAMAERFRAEREARRAAEELRRYREAMEQKRR